MKTVLIFKQESSVLRQRTDVTRCVGPVSQVGSGRRGGCVSFNPLAPPWSPRSQGGTAGQGSATAGRPPARGHLFLRSSSPPWFPGGVSGAVASGSRGTCSSSQKPPAGESRIQVEEERIELSTSARHKICEGSSLPIFVPSLTLPLPVPVAEDDAFRDPSAAVLRWADLAVRVTLAMRNRAISAGLSIGDARLAHHTSLTIESRAAREAAWRGAARTRGVQSRAQEEADTREAEQMEAARCAASPDPLRAWQESIEQTDFGSRAGRNGK